MLRSARGRLLQLPRAMNPPEPLMRDWSVTTRAGMSSCSSCCRTPRACWSTIAQRFSVEIGRMLGEAPASTRPRRNAAREREAERLLMRNRRSSSGSVCGRRAGAFRPHRDGAFRAFPADNRSRRCLTSSRRMALRQSDPRDMKWDTSWCSCRRRTGFRIVDWEMADSATRLDVGAVLPEFFRMDHVDADRDGLRRKPISAWPRNRWSPMRPTLKAFWAAYADTAATRRASATASSGAAWRFGAARLGVVAARAARPRRKGRSRRCGAAAGSLNVLEDRASW